MLKIVDNFLSNEESNNLISFFNKNYNLKNHFCSVFKNTNIIYGHSILNEILIKDLHSKLNDFIKYNIHPNFIVDYFEIVKWPTNEFRDIHTDKDFRCYSIIVYLNDDFIGGETVIGDKKIKPKKNKLISFKGNKIPHKVNKIIKGNRYTIAAWCTKQSQ